ncbi:MFS transporter [Amnibacterium sp.]|uniref:MFS transporter n=1 Tax=Amnibacterium sp. TaxID=1872496 RepID=UPI002609061C|nr:MFS transporter [Amnibacterium sp.]MCU1474493.1 transporter [Amnibacterium sp.]
MILGSILNPINSSIIAVALVPIARAFGAPTSETSWLVSGLYLATAIGQPLTGRLVDQFGPRRLFLAGAVLTGIAGGIGLLAPSIWALVAARVVLGFGTCAGYPAAMTLIRTEGRRTGQERPAAILTVLSVATQTIAVVGPTLGGLLIAVGGWRATFALNIPLAVACLALGWWVLPKADAVPAGRRHLDLPGVLLFAATLAALLLFLLDPHVVRLWLLGIAVLAGAGFAVRELRIPDPFIDVRVFAGNGPLLATYARALFAATVSYAFLYGFTQWMEDGRGLPAEVAGLVLLPTFAVGVLVSSTTGRRPEVWAKLVVGAIAQVAVCAALLLLGGASPIWLLVAVGAVLGLPQGLVNLANQNALYSQADPERLGASAGLLRTFFYLGAILSSSMSGLFFGRTASTRGLHDLAWFMLASAAVLLVLTLADRSLRRVGAAPRPA